MNDQITISGAPAQWHLPSIARALVTALRRERLLAKQGAVVLSITVVGSARMRALNQRHRGKNRATDVLSFEQPRRAASPRGLVFLGDLVLCAPVVRAQACDARHGVRAEARVLLAHGLLHLLGHDHEGSRAKAKRMAAAEARLLGVQSTGLIARSRGKKLG